MELSDNRPNCLTRFAALLASAVEILNDNGDLPENSPI